MKLSVIIVNYNVKYYLAQCLDAVLRAAEGLECEVIVIDNRSTDGSAAYIRRLFPDICFIENESNEGFSRANNRAIAQASGEYILLLNPDTVIAEHTLAAVCDFMDKNPATGALGVKMIDGFGKFLPESKRGFPSPWNSFCKMSGLAKLFPQSRIFGGYHVRYLDENEVHKVDILSGAFMLLRRTALDKVGLLDEQFFMYGEDIDLSYRIGQAGFDVCYLPVTIIHYKGESTTKNLANRLAFYDAMDIFFRKHYPDNNRLFYRIIRAVIAMMPWLNAAVRKLSFRKERKCDNELVFNAEEMPYSAIISRMERPAKQKMLFRISHPLWGFTIAANEVQTTIAD